MKYSLSIQHSLGQMKQESPWRSPRQRTKDVVWEDLLLKTEGGQGVKFWVIVKRVHESE